MQRATCLEGRATMPATAPAGRKSQVVVWEAQQSRRRTRGPLCLPPFIALQPSAKTPPPLFCRPRPLALFRLILRSILWHTTTHLGSALSLACQRRRNDPTCDRKLGRDKGLPSTRPPQPLISTSDRHVPNTAGTRPCPKTWSTTAETR